MNLKKMYEESKMHSKKIKEFNSGDTVKVYIRIKEGEKERVQIFEGIVIAKKGKGLDSTFTVRKVSYGVGVERIFSLFSPSLEKVEVVTGGKTRRAKLYYLKNLSQKKVKAISEES